MKDTFCEEKKTSRKKGIELKELRTAVPQLCKQAVSQPTSQKQYIFCLLIQSLAQLPGEY
jgi:hypothetical protein